MSEYKFFTRQFLRSIVPYAFFSICFVFLYAFNGVSSLLKHETSLGMARLLTSVLMAGFVSYGLYRRTKQVIRLFDGRLEYIDWRGRQFEYSLGDITDVKKTSQGRRHSYIVIFENEKRVEFDETVEESAFLFQKLKAHAEANSKLWSF